MQGAAPDARGTDAVLAKLRGGVDDFDRKMDSRTPDFQTPSVEGDTLTMRWTVTYTKTGTPGCYRGASADDLLGKAGCAECRLVGSSKYLSGPVIAVLAIHLARRRLKLGEQQLDTSVVASGTGSSDMATGLGPLLPESEDYQRAM